MTILCIETSTSVCSAALWEDGRLIDQHLCTENVNHAKLLPRFVEALLQGQSERQHPDAVALSAGPGSYTGLRIGTSTAKGLCFGWQVPLVVVPTLEVLCAAAIRQSPAILQESEAILCPMVDARRMEVYTALYDTRLRAVTDVQAVVVEAEESLGVKGKEVYYFGDGAAKCTSILTAPNWHFLPDIRLEAQFVGPLAEQRLRDNADTKEGNDLAYYEPFYLKEFVAAQSHVKGLK